jgi:hypothetical protein
MTRADFEDALFAILDIDQNFVNGIGNTAFLGFNTPAVNWNYVARVLNYDPATEGSATIEIDSLIGIQDSTNGHSDSFFVSPYNQQGQFLAAIQLTNENQLYQIWREDGITTVNFIPNSTFTITASARKIQFTDPTPGTTQTRFYRVVTP